MADDTHCKSHQLGPSMLQNIGGQEVIFMFSTVQILGGWHPGVNDDALSVLWHLTTEPF